MKRSEARYEAEQGKTAACRAKSAHTKRLKTGVKLSLYIYFRSVYSQGIKTSPVRRLNAEISAEGRGFFRLIRKRNAVRRLFRIFRLHPAGCPCIFRFHSKPTDGLCEARSRFRFAYRLPAGLSCLLILSIQGSKTYELSD